MLIRIPVFLDFIIFSLLICFLFYAIAAGVSLRDSSCFENIEFYFIFRILLIWIICS